MAGYRTKRIAALLLATLAAGGQAQPAMPGPACRAEIVKLCGTSLTTMASCLLEKRDQLSGDCLNEVSAIAQRMMAEGRLPGVSATPGSAATPSAGTPSARRQTGQARRSPVASETLAYGPDKRQAVDIVRAASTAAAPPPILVFVHGGGWRMGDRAYVDQKPTFARASGYAFASIGYRLLPDAPVETQAADIAAGLRALRAEAGRFGFDANRIILMGHSAGAHLAALVATDERYLGPDLAAVRGVILLDGAAYDVPRQMEANRLLNALFYTGAFGKDPARQTLLSPANHTAAPNAPAWLIIHATDRADAGDQARRLGDGLRAAGAAVTVTPTEGDHLSINRDFGAVDYPAAAAVTAFLSALTR